MVTIEIWLHRTVDNLPSTAFDLNEHIGLVRGSDADVRTHASTTSIVSTPNVRPTVMAFLD